MHHLRHFSILLCAALLIAGCATGKSAKPQFSGYLGDYSKIVPVMGEGGEELRLWVNPRIKRGKYTKLMVDPVVFHTAPQATNQVSADTLIEINRYINEALRREFAKSYLLVSQVSPEAARVRVALTGVTAEVESAMSYEPVPFVAIAAGAESAASKRGHQTFLLVEAEVTDSVTSEKLGMAVRKIPAKKLLTDDKKQLSLDIVRPVLDDRAANARLILDGVLK